MPSYLAVAIAIAVSGSAWQNDVNAGLPGSRARITLFKREISPMPSPITKTVLAPFRRAIQYPPNPRSGNHVPHRPAGGYWIIRWSLPPTLSGAGGGRG